MQHLMTTTRDILKIYFYRVLSLVVGFGSMLVVIPLITDNVTEYATYSVTMGLCLFLTYGDLGFLSACQKYCAEAVGRGSQKEEGEFLGFTVALLIIVSLFFASIMALLAYDPELILKHVDEEGVAFASKMFLTTGLLMPVQVICQRTIFLTLSTRLKDYLFTRIEVIVNFCKILMCPLFVTEGDFLLYEFFVTSILMSIFGCAVGFCVIHFSKVLDLRTILSNLALSRDVYKITKNLAFSMMVSTFFWIMYYELDLIIAAQLFSVESVAHYALAFTFLSFLRSLWVSGFAPFLPLMNNYYGAGDLASVKTISANLITVSTPLFIITSCVLGVFSGHIVFTWVGAEYTTSATIISILLVGVAFNGFTNVGAHYMTTLGLYKNILIFGIAPVIVYYSALMILVGLFPGVGIVSLAYAKALSGLVASGMSMYFLASHRVFASGSLRRLCFYVFVALGSFFALHDLSIPLDFLRNADSASLIMLLVSLGIVIVTLFYFSMICFAPSRILIAQLTQQLTVILKTNF